MKSQIVKVLAAAVVAAMPALGAVARSPGQPSSGGVPASHWVNTWTAAPQLTEPANLPPPPFTSSDSVFDDSTLRQTLRVTVGGPRFRLRLSNAFGGAALPITKAAVALPAGGRAGVGAIQPGTTRPLSFDGRPSTVIPVGAQVVSDPVNMPLAPHSNLTVTMYLADGQQTTNVTSHPGSRTTSYMLAGDHVADTDVTSAATTVDHWYFISGVETVAGAGAVAVVGDSLTDGRGSTTNGNDRWTDRLADRLGGVAVLNQGLGGNRVLNDGLGPNALGRIDRDVLAQTGVRWLIVFEGVNDIGTADATDAAQKQTADELTAAFDQIITRAHAQGIRVYGATITPFGGNDMYDDPGGLRRAARQTVNQWIRTSGRFDAVLDFDKVARDPANPEQILPAFDSGDHLHLTPAGYKALADSVPAALLR